MTRALADRRDRLFGREGDLAELVKRARYKGLTAVVARPQMGKSWLLTELARRLSTEHEPPHLVGFAESFGETPDLLLRTVVDLYARWLSDAGSWQRAKKVWQNEKANLLPGVAHTVTTIFKELADAATKPAAVVVEEAIKSLVAADERLRTGGLRLPTLSYEQGRDLVGSVTQISGRPIALFLDQWEKSPDTTLEAGTLDAFIRHQEEWPRCHIFLALRPDEPAFGTVQRLAASRPGPVKLYDLGEMDLADEAEQLRLVGHVKREVPAADDVDDQFILDRIDGFPGVIGRWKEATEYDSEHMQTGDDLARVAADALAYRYSELQDSLKKLDADERRLAIRVALLPLSDQSWPILKKEWLGDLSEDLIDQLVLDKVFESRDPPSFGHAKRWEAAHEWFSENRRAGTRSELEDLIGRLSARVRSIDPTTEPYASALMNLFLPSLRFGASYVFVAASFAAATLFDHPLSVDEALVQGANDARSTEFRAMAPLLAMGLVKRLLGAKEDDDLATRDALFDALLGLAEAHPEDPAVRDRLARGLLITLIQAKAEDDLARRDALLDKLRGLVKAHPADAAANAAMREQLAVVLNDTLVDANKEHNFARRDALLDELRTLASAHPQDATVREALARGLLLISAGEENDLARRDALLDELRALARAHPEDAVMRETLGRSLYNALTHAIAEADLARRDALLDELRVLAIADPAVREPLAKGLVSTLTAAGEEHDLVRRNALLDELRALAEAHPDDAAVRHGLAMACSAPWSLPRRSRISPGVTPSSTSCGRWPRSTPMTPRCASHWRGACSAHRSLPRRSRISPGVTPSSTSCGRWPRFTPMTPRCASHWRWASTIRWSMPTRNRIPPGAMPCSMSCGG